MFQKHCYFLQYSCNKRLQEERQRASYICITIVGGGGGYVCVHPHARAVFRCKAYAYNPTNKQYTLKNRTAEGVFVSYKEQQQR